MSGYPLAGPFVVILQTVFAAACLVVFLVAVWFWDRSPQQTASEVSTDPLSKQNCFLEPVSCDISSDCKELCVEGASTELVCRQIGDVGPDGKTAKVCGAIDASGASFCNAKFGGMNVFQTKSELSGTSFGCISSAPNVSATKNSKYINNGVCNGPEVHSATRSVTTAPSNSQGSLGDLGLDCNCPVQTTTMRDRETGLLFCAPVTISRARMYADHFEVVQPAPPPPEPCVPREGGSGCEAFFKSYSQKWDDGSFRGPDGQLQTDRVASHVETYMDEQDLVYGSLDGVRKGCALQALPQVLDLPSFRSFVSTSSQNLQGPSESEGPSHSGADSPSTVCPLVDRSDEALARGFGSNFPKAHTIIQSPCYHLSQEACNHSFVAFAHNGSNGWLALNDIPIDAKRPDSLLYMAVCKWHVMDGTCRPASERVGRTPAGRSFEGSFIEELRKCQSKAASSDEYPTAERFICDHSSII